MKPELRPNVRVAAVVAVTAKSVGNQAVIEL
jgi:hypothetical protein